MRLLLSLFLSFISLVLYLSTHAQDSVYCLDLDQPDLAQYELFNEDVKGKKIIMIGERHYMEANYILQPALLIHLNKHFGVRHLLIEFGRAEAYLYNRYLKTGDLSYLSHTFNGFNNYDKFFTGMKKLYEYNSGLEHNKKIIVHGLDLEREPGLSTSLYELLSYYPTDPQLRDLLDVLRTRLDTIGAERDNEDYIQFLKERISALSLPVDENKKTIDEILNNKAFYARLWERDQYMVETFMAMDTIDEVYLAQFGRAHTMLNTQEGFAVRLNKMDEYHNKILVVNMFAMDSKSTQPIMNVSDCPVFLYRLDPTDEQFAIYSKLGQWVLILKDQPGYKPVKF
jgi:erythromycin esterase-like protein